MIALVWLYRRPDQVLLQGMLLTDDNGWRYDEQFQVLPRDCDDEALGCALEQRLNGALELPRDLESSPVEVAAFYRAFYRAAGVRSERAFGMGCDAVTVQLDSHDRRALVTPMVTDIRGGFSAFGGEVEAPSGWTPDVLGRMCREAWARGGVRAPSERPDDE